MIAPKQFKEFKQKFIDLAVVEYPKITTAKIEELFEAALEELFLEYARIEIERKLAALRGNLDI